MYSGMLTSGSVLYASSGLWSLLRGGAGEPASAFLSLKTAMLEVAIPKNKYGSALSITSVGAVFTRHEGHIIPAFKQAKQALETALAVKTDAKSLSVLVDNCGFAIHGSTSWGAALKMLLQRQVPYFSVQ